MRLAVIPLLIAFALPAPAQTPWPAGKTAAIVLTYDDALDSQLDVAIPQLDAAHQGAHLLFDWDLNSCHNLLPTTGNLRAAPRAARRDHTSNGL